MPSPFTRLQAVTSKRPPKPQAIEPVPERYAGENNPYRGTEAHGIVDDTEPLEPMDYAEGRPAVYDEPIEEPEPVPVMVVNRAGRERRRCRNFRAYATVGLSAQIVGQDESRTKVRIKNLGASDIYIGENAQSSDAISGWTLAQNEVYESFTQEELYARSSHATDSMQVSVHVEYAVSL